MVVGISVVMFLLLSIGFVIGFVSYVPIQKTRAKRRSAQKQKIEEARLTENTNRAAPIIISETLDGEKWYLADQSGKVVVVFFWSVVCGSCIDEIPAMNSIYSKYENREDFLLVGVHRYPDRALIACYCSVKEILWPQLHEKEESGETGFFNKMDIKRTPTVCIFDREGKLKGIYVDVSKVEGELESLL